MGLTEGGFSIDPGLSWVAEAVPCQHLHEEDHVHLCCCQENVINFTAIIYCAWYMENAHNIYCVD